MKEIDDVIIPAHLIGLKLILDKMISQNRIDKKECEAILQKAGIKKKGKVWVDEFGSEYANL